MGVRKWTDAKGRKRYAVEFEVRGHRVFRRLPPGATKGQADALHARLHHELIDQAVVGRRPDVSLEAAIDLWLGEVVRGRKSEPQTRNHAARVKDALHGERWNLVRVQDASGHIRGDDRISVGTRNRRLCILKAVAKFAWRKGWLEENLSGKIQLLPEPKYRRREVTLEDAKKLIDHAPTPRAKALIALSAYTGMRLGEVIKLRPADVRGGVIHVRDSKNGTDRVVPILPELEPHLKQLPFDANWRNVYRGFEEARRRAGIAIRYHDLRHMVASALARSDADLRLSMDLMGHKSIETHRRYVHTDVERKRAALSQALGSMQNPIRRGAKKAA